MIAAYNTAQATQHIKTLLKEAEQTEIVENEQDVAQTSNDISPIFGLWVSHGIQGDSGEYLAQMRETMRKRLFS